MDKAVIWALIALVLLVWYLVRPYTPKESERIMASRADLANRAKRTGMGGSPGKPSPRPVYGAEIFAHAGGPRTWTEYIGQNRAQRILKMATISAKSRNERLDHILIATGMHGVGKSAIARVIANSIDAGIVEVQGELTGDEATGILSGMRDGDILFIDEAHKLVDKGKRGIEWLLPLLQDGVMITSQGPKAMPKVTLILATTDKDLLPETILSRLPIKPVLEPYTPYEGTEIARGMAKGIFGKAGLPDLDTSTLRAVSDACSETPREINALLCQVRDAEISGLIERGDDNSLEIEPLLDLIDRTHDGLDSLAQTMLLTLLANGGIMSRENLSAQMQEPTYPRFTEKVLLHKGLMTIQKWGRSLTEDGAGRANALAEKFSTED